MSRIEKWGRYVVAVIILIAAQGCGEDGAPRPGLVDVAGVVKINGQPAENILVKFFPDAELGPFCPAPFAVSGADGTFELTAINGAGAAVAGKHLVTLVDLNVEVRRDPTEDDGDRELIPRPENSARIPTDFNTVGPNSPSVEIKEDGELIVIDVVKK